jgi:hypothetical protein
MRSTAPIRSAAPKHNGGFITTMKSEAVKTQFLSSNILRRASLASFLLSVCMIVSAPIIFPGKSYTTGIIAISIFINASALFSIDLLFKFVRKEKVEVVSIVFGVLAGLTTFLSILILVCFIMNYPSVPSAA